MISVTTSLSDRIDELAEMISALQASSSNEQKFTTCVCINKNFSNLQIVSAKKLLLTTITLADETSLVFQGEVSFNLIADEEVEISLLSDSTLIQKQSLSLSSGKNAVSIFCNFTPILVEKVSIYLKITPKNNKTIFLESASLFIWGTITTTQNEYSCSIETDDKYLISYNSSGSLYYLYSDKSTSEFGLSDYVFYGFAKQHSLVYSEQENVVYLFRVDENDNLFYGKFNENERYLFSNISHASACLAGGVFYVFCISNSKCYFFYIDGGGAVSPLKKIDAISGSFSSVYCYYNKTINQIYVVLLDENNSNFLLVQKSENFSSKENIKAVYSISVKTYEGGG